MLPLPSFSIPIGCKWSQASLTTISNGDLFILFNLCNTGEEVIRKSSSTLRITEPCMLPHPSFSIPFGCKWSQASLTTISNRVAHYKLVRAQHTACLLTNSLISLQERL